MEGQPGLGEPVPRGLVGRITAPELPGEQPVAGEPCDAGSALDSWRVGPDRGLANVIVEALPVAGEQSVASSDSDSAGPPDVLEVRVENCRFRPRVSVVRRNTLLKARHDDPGLHTFHLYRAFAQGPERSLQNIAVPPGGPPVEWTLDLPARLHLRSDQLEWMEGWIVVTEHPSAITDVEGRFVLPELAPGEWEIVLWHERLGEHRAFVTIPADGPASLYIEFPVSAGTPRRD